MKEDLFSSRFLMCQPDYYSVLYSINPWMDLNNDVGWHLAFKQWQDLHHLIIRLGGYVEYIDPQPGWPDMVFTANAGFVVGKNVLLSRFRYPQRAGEQAHFRFWFEQRGYSCSTTFLPFEGAGDMLASKEHMFIGHGFRTDREALDGHFSFRYEYPSVTPHWMRLIDPRFYHLDTCFCPLGDNKAIFYPGAFEKPESIERMLDTFAVPEEEAVNFACNAIQINDAVILPEGCPKTCRALEEWDFVPYPVDMSEFIKSGGACKCLTLRLGSY